MAIIYASVGRGGVNRPEDVRVVQELLNKQTRPPMQLLQVDGMAGPKTIAAIEAFQRQNLSMTHPDGRVDPDGQTLIALSSNASVPPPTLSFRLPTGPGRAGLMEADFERAARTLQCEIAGIKAVADVESRGDGFFASGRPKILFEAHVFSRRTQHKHDGTHSDISSPSWNRALYNSRFAHF